MKLMCNIRFLVRITGCIARREAQVVGEQVDARVLRRRGKTVRHLSSN